MYSRLTYATFLLILILPLIGCEHNDRSKGSLEDDLGREVTIDLPATRVVTLAPSLTEMVFAAGAGDRLVGVGEPDDYPPAVDTLPRYATYPVDFEAIRSLAPRLALATDQVNSPRDATTLEALHIPTYFLSFSSLNDVFEGLETIGRLLGTEDDAALAADSLRLALENIRSRTEQASVRPTVLFLIGSETLFSFGSESYVHEMIESAGGRSITAEMDAAAPILSEEYVLTRRPQVIMGSWGTDMTSAELLEHHPSWSSVPAVRDGRIYGVDASLVVRPGPRLIRGVREMASKLHPSLFDDSLGTVL